MTSVRRKARQLTNLLIAIAAGLAASPLSAQIEPPEAQRISLQIATGPASGSYLRVGEVVAKIVSHPPGLGRCDVPGVCGPEGLIATLRSSSGSVANAIAVNAGRVKSGLVQGDIAAAAREGQGPFRQSGPLKNLRAIARLHEETLHLVVAPRSRIRKLSDLAGKRVGIDGPRSATNHTVRLLLEAAKINPKRLALSFEPAIRAGDALENGKLDAFFVIGAAPVSVVDRLVRRGQARVISLDAAAISKLARDNAMFSRRTLPGDSYRSSKAVLTLDVATIWVVQQTLPDDVVREILRSLWNPANRGELRRLGKLAATIDPAKAAENLPLPLHPGAERFYADAGR
jgi:hypothetical protein